MSQARLWSAWQAPFTFSSSFPDTAKLAASVGSKWFIFIRDVATGSADLSLGFSWLLPRPWLTSWPQAPGDICSPQMGLNKFQMPFLKALCLAECNPGLISATLSQLYQHPQPAQVKSFRRLNSSPERRPPHTVSSLALFRQWAVLVNPLSPSSKL